MATKVEFTGNYTVDENKGTIKFKVVRTGDLSKGTTVFFTEDWGRSSATSADVSFNQVISASVQTFKGTSGAFYFAPGDDTAYIEYRITDDVKIENNETFYLKLTSAIGATIDDSDTRLTITDNDTPVELPPPPALPEVIIDNAGVVNEGDFATFTVRVVGQYTTPVTVTLATYRLVGANAGGNDTDYDGIGDPGTPDLVLTFNPGASSTQTVRVKTFTDAVLDDNEQFQLKIESVSPNATFAPGEQGTVTIRDVVPATTPTTDPTLPFFPLPDLTTASGNQAFPDDVSRALARDAITALLQAAADDRILTGTNAVTFGIETNNTLASNYLWNELRLHSMGLTDSAVIPVSVYTPNGVKTATVYDAIGDVALRKPFGTALNYVGKAGDVIQVGVKYSELTADKKLSLDDVRELDDTVYNTLVAGILTKIASSGLVILVGSTPVGWGVAILGPIGFSIFVDTGVGWVDPLTGIANITSRPADFNPFQRIDAMLDRYGEELFGEEYLGGRGGGAGYPGLLPSSDDNDTDGSSGGSGGGSSGGSSTPTPPPSTDVTTPNDIGVIGTNDFGVGVEFTLTAASEVDTLFHLTTTGGVRNFVSVLIDHTTGLLKGEVAWLGNGQSYSEYLSVPLANLPFTVGLSHTVALARVNLPDGSTRLELWFDGVVVDTTLTTAVPNLPAFTVVEVGQMTNWYSGSVQHPATGTFGALQVGTAETLFTAPETPATTLSPTPTIISGTSGDDDFTGATGDQSYEGGTGYDEVKYFGPGSRSDAFVFTQQADGSVLASSPAFGEDTLTSIEGIWFDEEAKWYSLEQLLTTPATIQVIMGTIGDDVLVAETGGRTYDGLAGFDQIDFYGPASYTHLFTASARSDGGVELTSDAFGVTVLYGVESVWFDWSGEWYLVEDLLNSPTPPVTPTTVISGTSGDDDFTGATGDQRYEGGAGYDEVKYFGPGSRSDAFVFTQQADGSVLASSPAFGEDTLTSIEGIWFDEEAKWYSVPTLLAMAGVVTGTPGDETFVGVAGNTIYQDQGGFDQIDYNGPGSTRDAFVFTARADGGVQVVSTTFGTDTLYGVESVWFDWDGAWYLTTDLLV